MTTSPDFTELATELETRRAKAVRANDATALGELLSADLRYVHSGGSADDRTSLLEKLSTGGIVYSAFQSTIERVVPLGVDAFLVTGRVHLEATLGGSPRMVDAVYLLVWRKEGETWRLVALQNTNG